MRSNLCFHDRVACIRPTAWSFNGLNCCQECTCADGAALIALGQAGRWRSEPRWWRLRSTPHNPSPRQDAKTGDASGSPKSKPPALSNPALGSTFFRVWPSAAGRSPPHPGLPRPLRLHVHWPLHPRCRLPVRGTLALLNIGPWPGYVVTGP